MSPVIELQPIELDLLGAERPCIMPALFAGFAIKLHQCNGRFKADLNTLFSSRTGLTQ